MYLRNTFAAWASDWGCDSCAFVPSSLLRFSCHGASPLTSAQLSSAQARRGAAGFQSSAALHRDAEQSAPEVKALRHALLGADQVFTTGLVLQELLQGFAGPKDRAQLVEDCRAAAKHVGSHRWGAS